MGDRFEFRASWSMPAPPEAVAAVVADLEHYPDWWPQVVAVASLGPDDARVLCRSTLPYTLDLVLHAVSRDLPRLQVDIDGDLRGSAAWTLSPEGAGTRMDFAQAVDPVGLPTWLVKVARPVLAWNHERMMAGCERGLRAALRSPGRSG
jgi:hypothetical protein